MCSESRFGKTDSLTIISFLRRRPKCAGAYGPNILKRHGSAALQIMECGSPLPLLNFWMRRKGQFQLIGPVPFSFPLFRSPECSLSVSESAPRAHFRAIALKCSFGDRKTTIAQALLQQDSFLPRRSLLFPQMPAVYLASSSSCSIQPPLLCGVTIASLKSM